MKLSIETIGEVMEKVLGQFKPSVPFESVWNKGRGNNYRLLGIKKAVAVPLLVVLCLFTVFSVGAVGYSAFRNMDRVDYPFIDDFRVIGKWEAVDFVTDMDTFDPEKKTWPSELYLSSLVFIKKGRMLSASNNGNLAYTSFSWTKDRILNKQEKTDSQYWIKDINGTRYMFFEWKSGNYTLHGQQPQIYVLRQVDAEDYSGYQVKRVREDNVDYPFENDPEVRGKWETVDFVRTMDSFTPGVQSWYDLYLKTLYFGENGKFTMAFEAGSHSTPTVTWTKGLVINKGQEKTASQYTVKKINGDTYLFYQWKNGDYLYRGATPYYYVLKKVE